MNDELDEQTKQDLHYLNLFLLKAMKMYIDSLSFEKLKELERVCMRIIEQDEHKNWKAKNEQPL